MSLGKILAITRHEHAQESIFKLFEQLMIAFATLVTRIATQFSVGHIEKNRNFVYLKSVVTLL